MGRAQKDLVATMQILSQGQRLLIAPTLEHAATLATELQHFQLKSIAGTQQAVIEWRERSHDDLVLATAVAVWHAERPTGGWVRLL
jgi:hypothetical protein